MSIATTDDHVTTDDGTRIALRRYLPGPGARGAVFLAAAMGVPQRFYEPFARWLASEGFHVLTFDYRGMGRSKTGPLRDVDADIVTWAEHDTAAALDALVDQAGDLPITWIGHSLGGQIIPFVPNRERAEKIVTIATGSGYWKENAAPLRRKVWLFWYGAVPLTTPLFGYFPGKRLGMVGDLPKGVIRQWRRWCMDKDYAVGAEGAAVRARFDAVTTPITSFSFEDDEMMSAANIASIHSHYRSARRDMRRLAPSDLGLARIGHFGAFREPMKELLWRRHFRPELVERVADLG